ncbi:MAG TPA: hypothetical protein VHS97_12785 [Isosphaeraceae bacterium]|nr:hypothetical protein [Isosphaeraceae bacterium]
MSGKRYADKFKIEAVKQVTEHGRFLVAVAQRLETGRRSFTSRVRAALRAKRLLSVYKPLAGRWGRRRNTRTAYDGRAVVPNFTKCMVPAS